MLLSRAQVLSPFTLSLLSNSNPNTNKAVTTPMRPALTILRSLAPSLRHHHHHCRRLFHSLSIFTPSPPLSLPLFRSKTRRLLALPLSTFVEHVADETDSDAVRETGEFSKSIESDGFDFDASFESTDLKRLKSPPLEVRELEELPEQWRRSKLAWLCKELPAHKAGMLIRVLNAQRKWIRQEDATYLAVHCMRIRENETGFRVYKWMMHQHWFRFDFALATKLADFMGKERKYLKCREIFDDIINQGRVPRQQSLSNTVGTYRETSIIRGCI